MQRRSVFASSSALIDIFCAAHRGDQIVRGDPFVRRAVLSQASCRIRDQFAQEDIGLFELREWHHQMESSSPLAWNGLDPEAVSLVVITFAWQIKMGKRQI